MRLEILSRCVIAGCFWMTAFAGAQDQPKKSDKPDQGQESKAKKDDADEEDALAELEKMFVLPEEGSAQDYANFIERIQKYRPDTDEQARMVNRKAPLALKKAAEKVVKLEKDKASAIYRRAAGILVVSEANQLLRELAQKTDGVPDEKLTTLVGKVADYLALGDAGRDEAQLAMELAGALEQLNKPDLARQAYEKLATPIAASKDEAIAREGRRMAGIARRMGLKGKPVELRGKTVDGKDFDIESLKGKVVLVDFWATWCGPCIAEHPNIVKNYEAYKDKGFEVVGISLDEENDTLKEYLDNEKVAWITLHEEGGGWNSELAVDFGINAIPSMLLLDKEGKLVTTSARGEQLGKQLETLLGPAEKKEDGKDGEKDEKKGEEKSDDGSE